MGGERGGGNASVASIYFRPNTSHSFMRSRRMTVIDLGMGDQFLFH
jgi:hypothetical protein